MLAIQMFGVAISGIFQENKSIWFNANNSLGPISFVPIRMHVRFVSFPCKLFRDRSDVGEYSFEWFIIYVTLAHTNVRGCVHQSTPIEFI